MAEEKSLETDYTLELCSNSVHIEGHFLMYFGEFHSESRDGASLHPILHSS